MVKASCPLNHLLPMQPLILCFYFVISTRELLHAREPGVNIFLSPTLYTVNAQVFDKLLNK